MRKTWVFASREEGTGKKKLNQPHFVYEHRTNMFFQCVAQSIAIITRCMLRIWEEDSKLTEEIATAPEYFVDQKSQQEKRNFKKLLKTQQLNE